MRKQKGITIGLLIPNLFDHYQEMIWRGIQEKAEQSGARVICYGGGSIQNPLARHTLRNELYDNINPDMIDVFLLLSGPLFMVTGLEYAEEFCKKLGDKPVISVGIDIPGITSILVDNKSAMMSIVSHLIEKHGCRNIGFITGALTNQEAQLRFEAYKEALKKYNIPYNPNLVYEGAFREKDGLDGYTELVEEKKLKLDALVGSDDRTMTMLLEYLLKRGIKVPEELIVTGFDDAHLSQYTAPPLTTARQPVFQLGFQAAELAIKAAIGHELPQRNIIKTNLVLRDSCGCNIYTVFNNFSDNSQGSDVDISRLKSISDLNIIEYQDSVYSYESTTLQNKTSVIIREVIQSLKRHSSERVVRIIRTLHQQSQKEELTISSWCSILSAILGSISSLSISEDDKKFIHSLWTQSLLSIYQDESHAQARSALMTQDLNADLKRFGHRLTTSFSSDDVFKVLNSNLPRFFINDCFISVFSKKTDTSTLVYSLVNTYWEEVGDDVAFPTKNLHPDLEVFDNNKSYMVLPLMTEEKQFGISVLQIDNKDGKIYESINGEIATAIKNVELIRKLNDYTHELETEVAQRTRQLEKANKLLKLKTYRDHLSGLMNRRYLMEVIIPEANQLLKTIESTHKLSDRRNYGHAPYFGVFIIDIDHFKKVNDTYGHYSGDLVIKQFGSLLVKHSRKEDFVIRLGGEEFLIIMKNFNRDFLADKAEEIRAVVENFEFEIESGEKISKTTSIGCVTYPIDIDYPNLFDLMTTIKIADKGLYHAKEHGRNQAIQITAPSSKILIQRYTAEELINNFEEAADRGDIQILDTKKKSEVTENFDIV